jgi:hypothetical protein
MFGYIRDAITEIEREQASVQAEYDAFAEFGKTIQSIDTISTPSPDPPASSYSPPVSTNNQLQKIQDCYQNTIMSIPDFEAQYDETLQDSMSAEFGWEITRAVLCNDQFTPPLQDLLVAKADAATRERKRLLQTIDNERKSLVEKYNQLEKIEQRLETKKYNEIMSKKFDWLVAYYYHTIHCENQCESILAKRQRKIQNQINQVRSGNLILQEYLYQDLKISFPILRAGVEQISHIRDQRQFVFRMISYKKW